MGGDGERAQKTEIFTRIQGALFCEKLRDLSMSSRHLPFLVLESTSQRELSFIRHVYQNELSIDMVWCLETC